VEEGRRQEEEEGTREGMEKRWVQGEGKNLTTAEKTVKSAAYWHPL